MHCKTKQCMSPLYSNVCCIVAAVEREDRHSFTPVHSNDPDREALLANHGDGGVGHTPPEVPWKFYPCMDPFQWAAAAFLGEKIEPAFLGGWSRHVSPSYCPTGKETHKSERGA